MKISRVFSRTLVIIAGLLPGCGTNTSTSECDRFVSWIAPAKEAYMKTHQVYPVPEELQALAVRYMPKLWVHPESWHPISFEEYLAQSKLLRKSDGKVLMESPSAEDVAALDLETQCGSYFEAADVAAASPAPLYIQLFRDRSPADPLESWTYIKYNPVFDWSGLAKQMSWVSHLGAFFGGGKKDRWHRLDVHTSAILAFDNQKRLRMLTLAQHNHQQTYLPGRDFPADQPPILAAALRSNELYLDGGESTPVEHRVVPFFTKVSFLIDPKQKPWLWALDVTYGRHAGGEEVPLRPVFPEPKHPLADFSGLLAPPRRLFGMYIGRDGPPGYNYYALPAFIPMPDFAAIGFWRGGDLDLLAEISPLLKGFDDTDWEQLVRIMRGHLGEALEAASHDELVGATRSSPESF
ncbi:MAG: hypothetical protein GY801_15925 [bacterium]|nr:hypothetical protein [bacterium]